MDFYLKELPDNTVTLISGEGQIIGKFDSLDEAEDLFLENNEYSVQATESQFAKSA